MMIFDYISIEKYIHISSPFPGRGQAAMGQWGCLVYHAQAMEGWQRANQLLCAAWRRGFQRAPWRMTNVSWLELI